MVQHARPTLMTFHGTYDSFHFTLFHYFFFFFKGNHFLVFFLNVSDADVSLFVELNGPPPPVLFCVCYLCVRIIVLSTWLSSIRRGAHRPSAHGLMNFHKAILMRRCGPKMRWTSLWTRSKKISFSF